MRQLKQGIWGSERWHPLLSIDCSPPNKKRTGDSFRCKHEVRPSKLNYFYVVIVLGYAPELNHLESRKKSRGSGFDPIFYQSRFYHCRPNPTTRIIVLGKIFLYQNLSWMPTRDPFLLPYIKEEAYINKIKKKYKQLRLLS